MYDGEITRLFIQPLAVMLIVLCWCMHCSVRMNSQPRSVCGAGLRRRLYPTWWSS